MSTLCDLQQAMERVDELLGQGFRLHEAEEVALREFILLSPEPGAELDDEEAAEAAEREAEYQAMMRDPEDRWN